MFAYQIKFKVDDKNQFSIFFTKPPSLVDLLQAWEDKMRGKSQHNSGRARILRKEYKMERIEVIENGY